ncbi:putative leucine-rich repeat domain superfamily [Helianthus anomalus]
MLRTYFMLYLQPLKTDSLVKMKKLKLLRLNYVEFKGSYKRFSEFRKLRLLSWHGCVIRTIPSSMWISSLVALHLCNGRFEKFEPPTVHACTHTRTRTHGMSNRNVLSVGNNLGSVRFMEWN